MSFQNCLTDGRPTIFFIHQNCCSRVLCPDSSRKSIATFENLFLKSFFSNTSFFYDWLIFRWWLYENLQFTKQSNDRVIECHNVDGYYLGGGH
jgi:hypothetical protein